MTMDLTSQNPETPQRGRSRGRYPVHLMKGDENRVPLHRRGTSRTYERLEDLLREAGYKETRVFTPEAERLEAEAEERREREQARQLSGSGVGAVVSFLSGLVPKHAAAQLASKTHSSGMADGQIPENMSSKKDLVSTPPSPSPKASTLLQTSPLTLTLSSPQSSSTTLSSRASNPPMKRNQPNLSAAHAALRHMASAPVIPETKHRRSIDQDSSNDHPPLPSNWLQTVTKAVAGYGPNSGAYVGRPSSRSGRATPRHRASDFGGGRSHSQRPILRTRSTIGVSKLAIVDSTNKFIHPHSQRACSCVGPVATTSVVCHSAPSSRSASRVRGKDKEVRLPSLGITSVEGESWPTGSPLPHRPGQIGTGQEQSLSDESSDDEDIGELNLARILVPAKRQKSIRSLRQHLHRAQTNGTFSRPQSRNRRPGPRPSNSSSNSALNSLRGSLASGSNADVDDSFEVGLQRDFERRRRGSVDENDHDVWLDALPGLTTTKKRGQLPWVPWTQGRS